MEDRKQNARTRPHESRKKKENEGASFAEPKAVENAERSESQTYVRMKDGKEYRVLRRDGMYLYCREMRIRHSNENIACVFEKKEG